MSLCGFPCFQTKASLSLQKCAVSPHAAPTGVTQTPLLPQHSPSSQLVPQCLQPPHPPTSQVRPRTGPLRRVSLSHGPPGAAAFPGPSPPHSPALLRGRPHRAGLRRSPQDSTPEGDAPPRSRLSSESHRSPRPLTSLAAAAARPGASPHTHKMAAEPSHRPLVRHSRRLVPFAFQPIGRRRTAAGHGGGANGRERCRGRGGVLFPPRGFMGAVVLLRGRDERGCSAADLLSRDAVRPTVGLCACALCVAVATSVGPAACSGPTARGEPRTAPISSSVRQIRLRTETHTHTKWGYKNGEGTEGAAVRSTETLRCVGPRAEEAEGRPHGGRSSSQRTLSNWSGSAAPWGSHCRIFFPHHCGSEIPIASFKFPAPISFSSSHLTAPLSQPLGQFPVPSSPCSQLPTPS